MKFSLLKILIAISAITLSLPTHASVLVCTSNSEVKGGLMNKDKATCMDVKTNKYYILTGGGFGAGQEEQHGRYVIRCSAADPTGINGGMRLGFGSHGFLLTLGKAGGCAFSIVGESSNEAGQRLAFDGFKITEANGGISALTLSTLEQMADAIKNPKKD